MVYVLLGTGFEEIEALTPVDLLRRAGVEVKTVGLNGKIVYGSHAIGVEADLTIDELDVRDAEMIVLPGGLGGVASIRGCQKALEAVKAVYGMDKYVAAICAGPTVLADLGLLMDPTSGVTAAQRLLELSQDELAAMLEENSDEPYADEIAQAICRNLPIDTTRQLYTVIENALSFLPQKSRKQEVRKSCQRTFQALRIDVNSEFEVLYSFLEKLPGVLNPGARVAILTFHSGEDRLVKKAFKEGLREGLYSSISDGVIRPSAEECFRNSRAHSTKLRWAIKV